MRLTRHCSALAALSICATPAFSAPRVFSAPSPKSINATPLVHFENAAPRPNGAMVRSRPMQLMADEMRRARTIAPLANSQKIDLLGGGSALKLDTQPTIYATLSPEHLAEPGHADLVLFGPVIVRRNSDQSAALFGSSPATLGPLSSGVILTVTSPGAGLYLVDFVVTPAGFLASPPDTVNFNIVADSQTTQTISLTGGANAAPQHLVFALHATAPGDYGYTISSSNAAWVFMNCTITRMRNQ